jgi:hypothetical protein
MVPVRRGDPVGSHAPSRGSSGRAHRLVATGAGFMTTHDLEQRAAATRHVRWLTEGLDECHAVGRVEPPRLDEQQEQMHEASPLLELERRRIDGAARRSLREIAHGLLVYRGDLAQPPTDGRTLRELRLNGGRCRTASYRMSRATTA